MFSPNGLDNSNEIDGKEWAIGDVFLKGVLLEIGAFPKPGLVYLSSMGAHKDMNILTFMVSSAAISSAFYLCARAGRKHSGDIATLFPVLRAIGVSYEKRLLHSTKGVNTQRGILFSAGILCGAAGFASREEKTLSSDNILKLVREMTQGLVARELGSLTLDRPCKTAGEKLYLRHGTTGVRGEVETGFPTVAKIGLPAFRYALSHAKTLNEALVHTLLALMTSAEDSTIIWRKGMAQLSEVQSSSKEVLERGSVFTAAGRKAIRYLDRELRLKGISPGASADLLAVTVGLYLLENDQFPVTLL